MLAFQSFQLFDRRGLVGSFELDQGTVVKIMVKVDGLLGNVDGHWLDVGLSVDGFSGKIRSTNNCKRGRSRNIKNVNSLI